MLSVPINTTGHFNTQRDESLESIHYTATDKLEAAKKTYTGTQETTNLLKSHSKAENIIYYTRKDERKPNSEN